MTDGCKERWSRRDALFFLSTAERPGLSNASRKLGLELDINNWERSSPHSRLMTLSEAQVVLSKLGESVVYRPEDVIKIRLDAMQSIADSSSRRLAAIRTKSTLSLWEAMVYAVDRLHGAKAATLIEHWTDRTKAPHPFLVSVFLDSGTVDTRAMRKRFVAMETLFAGWLVDGDVTAHLEGAVVPPDAFVGAGINWRSSRRRTPATDVYESRRAQVDAAQNVATRPVGPLVVRRKELDAAMAHPTPAPNPASTTKPLVDWESLIAGLEASSGRFPHQVQLREAAIELGISVTHAEVRSAWSRYAPEDVRHRRGRPPAQKLKR